MKNFPGRIGEVNVAAAKRSYDEVKGPSENTVKEIPDEKTDLNIGGYGVLRDVSSWRVFTPVIDADKCTGCKNCWVFCPENAIIWDKENRKPSIKNNACKGCGICAQECPVTAIGMVRVEV